MITLSELARREFYDRSVARNIRELGMDLAAARLWAAQTTAMVFGDPPSPAEAEADAEEERRDGWSIS